MGISSSLRQKFQRHPTISGNKYLGGRREKTGSGTQPSDKAQQETAGRGRRVEVQGRASGNKELLRASREAALGRGRGSTV